MYFAPAQALDIPEREDRDIRANRRRGGAASLPEHR